MEWIFSGIGVLILTKFFSSVKRRAGFEVTYLFYVLVFIGLTIGLGVDYSFNQKDSWQLRIFLGCCCIIFVFLIHKIFLVLQNRYYIKKGVGKLSLKDCRYVLQCYDGDEYAQYANNFVSPLEPKWDYILHLRTGKMVVFHENYKICVHEYALKLVKKRLAKNQ